MFSKGIQKLGTYGIKFEDIKEITTTSATELEFWVQTPNEKAHIEELSTSEYFKNSID